MPVIAIINRKGGSGKSTLATHLAAHCANAGMSVMLGDVDQQQSTKTWLRLRAIHHPEAHARQGILSWMVEPGRGLRAPVGTTHVILDTPGGLSGFELARIALYADAILMPVCNSVFDRESAAACHAELMTLPRVASGRCKLAAIGMRVDARTRGSKVLREWADGLGLHFIGVLRDTQLYVRCLETGMSLFDLPQAKVQVDMVQWEAILSWLSPVLHPEVPPLIPSEPVLSRARRSATSGRATTTGLNMPEARPSQLAENLTEPVSRPDGLAPPTAPAQSPLHSLKSRLFRLLSLAPERKPLP